MCFWILRLNVIYDVILWPCLWLFRGILFVWIIWSSNNIHFFLMPIFYRLLASDTYGVISVWDRRSSTLPCLELTTNSHSTLNSIELNVENQVGDHNPLYSLLSYRCASMGKIYFCIMSLIWWTYNFLLYYLISNYIFCFLHVYVLIILLNML